MSFLETPRFPDAVAFGFVGGGAYRTRIAEMRSGFEQRNAAWSASRGVWRADHRHKTQADTDELIAYFHAVLARLHGFRFKDFSDFAATIANGRLGATGQTGTFTAAAVGNGLPSLQLAKRYSAGVLTTDRVTSKPVPDTVTVYRNAVAVTFGAGAGNIALDTTTGIVTFVADATSSASAITAGATTQVVLAANLGLTAGKLLHLSGFAGADAALVNSLAHPINSISGTGPYTFTLATNTSGKTITLGSGLGSKFPQASDALTWAGEFDVPCRFNTDQLNVEVVARLQGGEYVYTWGDIEIVEIRV